MWICGSCAGCSPSVSRVGNWRPGVQTEVTRWPAQQPRTAHLSGTKKSWVWSNSPWTLLITFPNAANTTPDISLKSHTTTPHGSTSNMHAPAAPAVRGRRRGGGGGGNRPARRVRNSPGRSNDCPILHGASSAPLGHLLRLDAVFGYHVAPLTLLWGLGRRGRRTLCRPTGYL